MKISGTKEWAASNENIQFGCPHQCRYCFSKAMSIRHKKIDIDKWHQPIIRQDKINKKFGKRKGTIMFPSTHDITPENIDIVIPFLRRMLEAGNKVLIVSKPWADCISELCIALEEFKSQIIFRFTIGSINDSVLSFWEPGAPNFLQRFMSLRLAHNLGFNTSVSCEPMLDGDTGKLLGRLYPYITDSIWFGKMNNLGRIAINGHTDAKTKAEIEKIKTYQSDENTKKFHDNVVDYFGNDLKIKWKESIKEVVGLDLAKDKGLDI